jgi:hypothetical protein
MYDSVIQLATHATTDRGSNNHHPSVIATGDFGVVPARLTLEAVQLSHLRSLLGYPGVRFVFPSSIPELPHPTWAIGNEAYPDSRSFLVTAALQCK